MKAGEKYCYRGYYIAHVSNPIPDSVFLNSSFGLTCLAEEIKTKLGLNSSKKAFFESMDLRSELTMSIWDEDFTLANRLLSELQEKVFMVRIEQYEPTDDSIDNQTSLF